MRQLVVEGELVEGFEIDEIGLVRRQHAAGDRCQDGVVFGAHDVLQEHLLRALFLTDPLVVREVEGYRLDPGSGVARGEKLIHNSDRRLRTAVEVLVIVGNR